MWRTHSEDSRRTTGESQITNHLPFITEFSKMLTRSGPQLGALSQHSFFSRHNPHPHRVRHIQGLSGRPICSVRDDWFVTSSLFPHPLLKSHVSKKTAEPTLAFPFAQTLYGANGNKDKSALFSEAWREELKEIAAKVSLSCQIQKDKRKDQPEGEPARRMTQYSAETGRIIPPSSSSYQSRSFRQHLSRPQQFHDQELMVLELLCQILQTDSLSAVQQWLLLAGQREKDLVMGMISGALDGVELSGRSRQSFHHLQVLLPDLSTPTYGPSAEQWRKARRTSSIAYQANSPCSNEKPERIGDAEVLKVNAGAQNRPQDSPLKHKGNAWKSL